MLFFPVNDFDPTQFQDSTLILPAISVGNVGQLSVDLLINTLNLPRVGFLEAENLIPCCGNDALSKNSFGNVTLALEVFYYSKCNFTVIQQRSLYPQGKLGKYCEEISIWCEKNKFKEIILLGGLDSGKRNIFQMEGDQVRYFSSKEKDGKDFRCENLKMILMENFSKSKKNPSQSQNRSQNENENISFSSTTENFELEKNFESENFSENENFPGPLHGGIWEKKNFQFSVHFCKLFLSLEEKNLSVLALTIFCCEGENTMDSFSLIQCLNDLFHFISPSENWVPPISWSNVFGPSPDFTLYG